MTKHRTVAVAVLALVSVSFFASRVVAADMAGIMMKDGKMMMMKNGKATGPMDHEMTMTDGCKVLPDGVMCFNFWRAACGSRTHRNATECVHDSG